MPSGQLTADDLDLMGQWERIGSDPQKVLRDLTAAIKDERIADPTDTGYALGLAAELTEHLGDRQAAIALARRSIAANLVHGGGKADFSRAHLAEMLFADGREVEAFDQLEPLRALMSVDAEAGQMATEALEQSGRAETAVEWLTEALATAITMGEAVPTDNDEAMEQLTSVVYGLSRVRHRLRHKLGLDHDEYDELAEELEAQIEDMSHPGPLLFWPEAEFDALLTGRPDEAEIWGETWHEHRKEIEQEQQAWADSGVSQLSVLLGSVAELVAYAEAAGADPADEQIQLDYADELPESRALPWPPARNGLCWCGSGAKYKKCCLPRGRS
jgi:tetratricopeptide (TPR) repeat protein